MGSAPLAGRRNHRYFWIAAIAGLVGFSALAISLSQQGDAAFPGLNGKIAYAAGQSYANESIYTANPDGTSPTQITQGTDDFAPSYSADGSKVVFNRLSGIVAMNADGSGGAQIASGSKVESSSTKYVANYEDPNTEKIIPEVKIETTSKSGHGFYDPTFTADGTQIVVGESVFDRSQESICAVEKSGDTECLGYESKDSYFHYHFECKACLEHLVMLSATTGAQTAELTPKTNESYDFAPTTSADGKIAFSRYVRGSAASTGLFIINAPGTAPTQLTSGFGNYDPDFSPDSTKLIFGHGEKAFGVIGVGGGAVSLIAIPTTPGSSVYTSEPTFSPDGTQIAFFESNFTPSTEEHGIFVVGVDGSNPHRVIADGYDPAWQPVPPPPPIVKSSAKAKKGKLKLDKKHSAVIGTVTCGSAACSLKVTSAKLKVGKKKCGAQVKAPKKLAAGKGAKIKATIKGKCLAKLEKAGKGALAVKIKVTSANGVEPLTLKSTLVPGKSKSGKSKGGTGHK